MYNKILLVYLDSSRLRSLKHEIDRYHNVFPVCGWRRSVKHEPPIPDIFNTENRY